MSAIVGFTKRESSQLTRGGYTAVVHPVRDGDCWVVLYEAAGRTGLPLSTGRGSTRRQALDEALAVAVKQPRCACGGRKAAYHHVCVRCGSDRSFS